MTMDSLLNVILFGRMVIRDVNLYVSSKSKVMLSNLSFMIVLFFLNKRLIVLFHLITLTFLFIVLVLKNIVYSMPLTTKDQDLFLSKYVNSHCLSPIEVSYIDPYTRLKVVREVSCGHCFHCQMTHKSEWITRLYCESLFSKYVYFLTLTYKGYKSLKSVPAFMHDTHIHLSEFSDNYTHVVEYTPTLLCKRHLQLYWKRLRKACTGVSIRYFSVGEYGHRFGRPHYHAIVFSDCPIDYKTFARAWCINNRVIGHIDLHTINLSDSKSAFSAFGYVCKYMFKSQSIDSLPTFDKYIKPFKTKYLRTKMLENYGTFKEVTPSQAEKLFEKDFGQFMLCSKRPFLGSKYFTEHSERFKKHDFRLFGLPQSGLVFPTFFVRKTKEVLMPYKCFSQVSDKYLSSSHIPLLASLLTSVIHSVGSEKVSYKYDGQGKPFAIRLLDSVVPGYDIPFSFFSFYSVDDSLYYYFNGYTYMTYDKRFKIWLDYCVPIERVLNMFLPCITQSQSFANRLNELSRISKSISDEAISRLFKSPKEFKDLLTESVSTILENYRYTQNKYLQSKTLF